MRLPKRPEDHPGVTDHERRGTVQLRRCRVVVSGRVQGVGFRDACRREASRVGAVGFIRNLPDGSVEAVVEAEPAVVEQLIAWLRVGPSQAIVTGFTVEDRSPEGGVGFSILI